jgi:hypothetical protein
LPSSLRVGAAWSICAASILLSSQTAHAEELRMKIRITMNDGRFLTATMEDSETARDFIALLPLSLVLDDYNKTEKISDLPKKLTTKGAPAASTPQAGDIAYYAPWGNLAIFYRDFGRSPGLIKLGTIDSGEALRAAGPIDVTIDVLNGSNE